MKACTKLLSILLVVAMFCSFGIVTAAAEENVVENPNAETPNEETLNEETTVEENVQSADLIVNGIVVKASEGVSGSKAVSANNAVAKIKVSAEETKYYASIADALEEAEKGQMVIVMRNAALKTTVYGSLTIPEDVSLSLNGMTVIFIPNNESEEAAVVMENGSLIKNGAIEVRTASTEYETFVFASVLSGEGTVSIKEVWVSNEGGYMLSGAAAAFDLKAVEDNPGVYKVVKPASEENEEPAEEESFEIDEEPVNENEEPAEGENEEPAEGENEEPAEGENEEPAEGENEEPAEGENEEPAEGENEEPAEGEDEEEIVDEPEPDIVIDEPDDAKIRDNTREFSELAELIAGGKDGGYWLVHDLDWNVTGYGALTYLYIDHCNYAINGDIIVPAGFSLTLKNGPVNGNITVYGTLTLINSRVNGTITLASNGTQAILNVKGDSSTSGDLTTAKAVVVDASSGTVSPNISVGKFGSITFTGSDANVVGGVTGGLYKNAVPAAICAPGTLPTSSSDTEYPFTVGKIPASVKEASGRTSADYYKGQPNQNYNLVFLVSPGLKNLSVKNAASKATVATLTSGTDYNYYAAGGRVEISKAAAFLENLPADALVLAFEFEGGGYVEFPLNVWANVTFTPSRYYKGSGTNVVFDVTDLPLEIIMDSTDTTPGTVLTPGTDYTISGKQITMPATFLENLPGGYHNFFFKYSMGGQTYRLRCTVAVLVAYRVIQINDVSVSDPNAVQVDWYTNSGKNLKFYVDGPADKFTGVKIGDVTLGAGNYSAAKGDLGTIVNINYGYLNTLAKGNYPVTFLYKDGEATAQFTVHYGSTSPRTGDENNLVLWAAVMVLSGAAVVALLPKKKKQ